MKPLLMKYAAPTIFYLSIVARDGAQIITPHPSRN
jgi:hypothetical protein